MGKVGAGLVESVLVLIAGLLLAIVGNTIYGEDGIELSRNYFPKLERLPLPVTPTTDDVPDVAPDRPPGVEPTPVEAGHVQPTHVEPGIAPAQEYDDAKWFKDTGPGDYRQLMGLDYVPMGKSPSWSFNELTSPQAQAFHAGATDRGILWVDARTREHWQEEHIPGAISLSHFHFSRDWPGVQGQVMTAPAIVIYCAGGDCDDSEGLATTLVQQAGLQQERIFIYRGGMLDWKLHQRQFEKGE